MVRRPKTVVITKVEKKPEVKKKTNKEVFDDLVKDKEALDTLKDVLFERGYIVVTEDDLVREMATQRVITGNTARHVIRDVVKNILAKEDKVSDL